jgi:hypothetical protein
LRVIYDLRILTPTMHGIARYALGLLRGILAAGPELTAALPGGLAVTALIPRPEDAGLLPQDPRLEVAVCDLSPYGLKAQFKLPRVL